MQYTNRWLSLLLLTTAQILQSLGLRCACCIHRCILCICSRRVPGKTLYAVCGRPRWSFGLPRFCAHVLRSSHCRASLGKPHPRLLDIRTFSTFARVSASLFTPARNVASMLDERGCLYMLPPWSRMRTEASISTS